MGVLLVLLSYRYSFFLLPWGKENKQNGFVSPPRCHFCFYVSILSHNGNTGIARTRGAWVPCAGTWLCENTLMAVGCSHDYTHSLKLTAQPLCTTVVAVAICNTCEANIQEKNPDHSSALTAWLSVGRFHGCLWDCPHGSLTEVLTDR